MKSNKEKELLEIIKEKEKTDETLLNTEIIIGMLSLVSYALAVYVVYQSKLEETIATSLILAITLILILVGFLLLKIEQVAGYYECQHCKFKHIPSFKIMLFAPHVGRTRYMKCPDCKRTSWQKKVVSKGKDDFIEKNN